MQTQTVKLKTPAPGGGSLAPPGLHPGDHTDHGACVVAIERVPTHLSTAAVLTAPAAAQGAGGAASGSWYKSPSLWLRLKFSPAS